MVQFGSGRRSENIEDRRRSGGPRRVAAAGGGSFILLLIVMFIASGGDLGKMLQMFLAANQGGGGVQIPVGGGGGGGGADDATIANQAELEDFVAKVLGDTELVWNKLFAEQGLRYREPTLVLFTGGVESACGITGAAAGPFYCPGDQKLYIDLTFYDQLRNDLGAAGDFAQAYVIAHEVGHHVQNLLGTMDKVHGQQGRLSQAEYNDLSVRLELQADYLAGVWAHHAQIDRKILEPGDIQEGMNAASAIGDDTLQRRSQGRVRPESFTHGTSAQRVRWLRMGLESGDLRGGDTFSTRNL